MDLGTDALEFKDAWFDGTVTSDAFAGPLTGDVTGTADVATVATTVTITDNESTNESNAVIFTAGGDVDGGNLGLESDGTLTYNPSTGKVTATGFIGAIDGILGANSAAAISATTIGATGVVTANAGVVVDNITIDGTEIDLSSGDLTIDVAGDLILEAGADVNIPSGIGLTFGDDGEKIEGDGTDLTISYSGAFNVTGSAPGAATFTTGTFTVDSTGDIVLDADGADILLKDGGTNFGNLTNDSTNFEIKSVQTDKDMIFKGNDGGSEVQAAYFDMSNAGTAIFGTGTASIDVEGTHAQLQVMGTDNNDSSISIARFDDGGNSPRLRFMKSRHGSLGGNALVENGDQLGNIGFTAADGNDFACVGARIYAEVDGVAAQDDIPTKLVFQTNSGAASVSGSRMEIGADGFVGIGNVEADQLLHLSAGNSYVFMESTEASNGDGARGNEISFIGTDGARAAMGSIRMEHDGSATDHSGKFEFWTTDGAGSASLYGHGQGGTAALIIYKDGNATLAGTLTESSDVALKTNINTIDSALNKVNKMRGVSYDRTDINVSGVGLVAQELEEIAPELVSQGTENSSEYKSVAYTKLTAYLVEAIKELTNKVKELEAK